MPGPWVHDIDPIIGTIFGVHLWWYGLSYSLGFLNAHLFFMRRRAELGLSTREVYELSLLLVDRRARRRAAASSSTTSGRSTGTHLALVPALWIGGMATHGLIIGGFAGVALFCLLRRKPLLVMVDAMAIPAALILCAGRIGNFIDGQIVGSVTTVPWAVKFPDAEGFRHPVVLYDGLKNLLIVPVLMRAAPARRAPRRARGALPVPLRLPPHLHRLLPRVPAHAARPAVGPDDEHPDVGGGHRAAVAQPAAADDEAGDAAVPRRPRPACGGGGRSSRASCWVRWSSPATRRATSRRSTASGTPGSSTRGCIRRSRTRRESVIAARASPAPLGTLSIEYAGGGSGNEVRRAIPLRGVRPVRRRHLSAGDAGRAR